MRRVGHHLQRHHRLQSASSVEWSHSGEPTLKPSLVEQIMMLAEDVKDVLVHWSEQSGERFAEHSLLWFRGAVRLMDNLGFLYNGQILTGNGTRNMLVMHTNGDITGPANRRDVNIWRQDFKFIDARAQDSAMR